ncbi:MAG TPA: flagellar biosynthesis protein FliQ [Burkholderiaceae bacterium]|nr:flagellar biosynthesis protein FliQ [Burkholderiaceae bacterium]
MITPDNAADLVRESLQLVTLLVAVLIAPALVVGLIVSMFQAATQINEQTLSFLPRLLVTLAVLALAGPWMIGLLMDFCVSIFQRAAAMVG